MTFADLGLAETLLNTIAEVGFTDPSPIQLQAIPEVIKGSDLQASAQTGTGKTAAFLLPILHRLISPPVHKGKGPRVLILVPTRELAMQVANEAKKFSANIARARTICIYGGAPYPVQNRELSRPYDILVATPGRLIDHMERNRVEFSRLEILILDEADRMLDMGFIEPVEQIAAATPKGRQTLLFSATLQGEVLNLSKRLLRNPVQISIAGSSKRHENIEQRLHYVDNLSHKHRLLDHLLEDSTIEQAIIFTSTKVSADELSHKLYEQGHNVAVLHGDMNQRQRTRTIAQMRKGDVRLLIATDVAARGIDVQTISHVINFDLPHCAEDYVHRIGRTGRAGAKGIALSFAGNREVQLVKRIEQFIGHKLEPHIISGFEPKSKPSPQVEQKKWRPRFGKPSGQGRFHKKASASSAPSFQREEGKSHRSGEQSLTRKENGYGRKPSKFSSSFKKREGSRH